MAVAIGEEQGLRGIFIYFSFACLPFFLASNFFWSWPCAMTRAVLRPFYSLSSLLWLSWGRRFPGNCSEYDVHRRIQGLPALPPFPLLGIIYFFIGVFRGIENILLDSTRLSDFNYPFFSFSSPFFPSSLINFIIQIPSFPDDVSSSPFGQCKCALCTNVSCIIPLLETAGRDNALPGRLIIGAIALHRRFLEEFDYREVDWNQFELSRTIVKRH